MNTPIFEAVCADYPDLVWTEDTDRIVRWGGEHIRTAHSNLRTEEW